MARVVDFWFDYTCPYAYLASTQVEAMAARAGMELRYRPFLLGGVFRARGVAQKLFATLSPAKARHNGQDLRRWAERFGVALSMPPGHPFRSVEALRATIASGCDRGLIRALYRAYWVEGRDIGHPEVLDAVVRSVCRDADVVLEGSRSDAMREALRAATDEAVAIGVFGAPAFVVDGALYWGQDRMHFVEGLGPSALIPDGRPTMPHTLEFYWDFSSPFAYLGATQARALADRTGATLVYRPMLLGGLFKSIGQELVPLNTWSDAKRRYYYDDMHRWAAFWKVPFQWPATFPVNSIKALRAWIALPEARREDFMNRAFRAYWSEGLDLGDEAVLRALLGDDADAVLAKTADPTVKQALIDATQRAVDAGVFGAPTWVVDGAELYWGQDRIPLVEDALRR